MKVVTLTLVPQASKVIIMMTMQGLPSILQMKVGGNKDLGRLFTKIQKKDDSLF